MKKYYSGPELDEIGEAIVRKFYCNAKSLPASVDIERLVEEHLGLKICYKLIAETPVRFGFLSDGVTPIWISENGELLSKVFPKGTMVIEKAFLNPNEDGRRRFTIAHEAAHFIFDRFVEKANFNTVFDKDDKYSMDNIKAMFSPAESQVDRLAAALLMPTYLFAYNYALHFPRNTIKVYGKHPDWKVFDKYIDEGKTGTSIKKRENFLRMMDDAREGCFDLIITREVSRFARNTVDALKATRELKSLGVEVWFVEDNIRTMNDVDGELRLTIMASLAQNESKKVSDRVKAGHMMAFKKGVPYGSGNILGYDKLPDHGQYVINEDQAKTVRMIYDLYLEGHKVVDIVRKLDEEGRIPASGKAFWDRAAITRTLKNSFYCGIVTYRKTYISDYLDHKPHFNRDNMK